MITFFLVFFIAFNSFSDPVGQKTKISFDKALPEDISNENFPDQIESFDFPNANLLDLVKAIGKLRAIYFIVDPALKSKSVSIIAPSPITTAEAYKAFLSALAANGYTIVKSGAFWKIQSTQKAHTDNIEVYSGDYFPNTDQLITRIIKLNHINAKDFSTSIKWLLSQDNKISTHDSSNSIILSDYGSVIERIMKIVYEMDIPGSEEGIEIIPVKYASPEDLAGILSELLSTQKTSRSSRLSKSGRNSRIQLYSGAKTSRGGNVKISKIIPDLRTKSLVVSANKEGLERIYQLIQKLDTPVDASRMGGVYVYNVLYGTAEEVYNTLMGIKPSSSPEGGRNLNRNLFSSSNRGSRASPFSRRNSSQSPLFENVTIMADTNTNSLIISADNTYDYERVLAVLKKIDVPRDQVFIQAIIVEMIINKGDNKELNLAWTLSQLFEGLGGDYIFKDVLGSSVGGFLNQAFDISSLQKAQFGPGLILGLPFANLLKNVFQIGDLANNIPELGNNLGFENLSEDRQQDILTSLARSYANSPTNQALQTAFFPLVRLLKTASNVNILSTPQLTTLDNVPAFIEVGENAPVGLTSTATVGALSQNSIDRQDVTLRLDIVPRINPESGTVQMDIKQKFDDFSNESPTASELASRSVRIVKRNIETKMVLHDGETAVLGGLLTDRETKNENKVPLLGDFPVVGWLFKGSTVEKQKRNLLVFITPTIIKGKEQREKAKEIVGQKLQERIQFVKKYMKGRDPHGEILETMIPDMKNYSPAKKRKKRGWSLKPQNLRIDFHSDSQESSDDEGISADEKSSEKESSGELSKEGDSRGNFYPDISEEEEEREWLEADNEESGNGEFDNGDGLNKEEPEDFITIDPETLGF